MLIKVRFEPITLMVPSDLARIANISEQDDAINEWLAEKLDGLDSGWDVIKPAKPKAKRRKPIRRHNRAVDAS